MRRTVTIINFKNDYNWSAYYVAMYAKSLLMSYLLKNNYNWFPYYLVLLQHATMYIL